VIEYINVRCNQWAEWHRRRVDSGLGFPKECCYTRLQGRGPDGWQLTIDESAWEIHRAVHSLDDCLRMAVTVFYLGRGTIEQRARDCRCSFKTLYRRIDQAHVEIMGWLNDESAGVRHSAYANTSCRRDKVSV
jgi:hypothetical protein